MSNKYSSTDKADNFESLISEIKSSIETHLKEMVSGMFIEADESLFELANSAQSNEDQNRYFELMRNMRALKEDISANFIVNTSSCCALLQKLKPIKVKPPSTVMMSLA